MGCHKPLGLPDRLESSHPTFSYPHRLMRLLNSIVGIPTCLMDGLRHYLAMSYGIVAQLIRHDLPRLTAMTSQ